MLEFELDYLRNIRLWFQPNQDLLLSNRPQIVKYSSHSNKDFYNKTVIIELLIPRGGRNIYGLLGANYIPMPTNNLEVSVLCGTNFNANSFKKSLIEKIEPVYLSISEEYCKAIFDKIESLSKNSQLNLGGKLNFCYGASSEISSNELIFSKLTNLIINLIPISEHKIDSGLLMQLIDS